MPAEETPPSTSPTDETQHPAEAELERLFRIECPGSSSATVRLREDLLRATLNVTANTILLTGESGTGKTAYANLIAFARYISRLNQVDAKRAVDKWEGYRADVRSRVDQGEGSDSDADEKNTKDGLTTVIPSLDDTGRISLDNSNTFTGGAWKMILANGLADTLFMSQLFGMVKEGATGVAEREGIFEKVRKASDDDSPSITLFGRLTGGGVFIDEIADAPAEVQGALLSVVNRGPFYRVGAETQEAQFYTGLTIFATNRVEVLEDKDRFRPDLLNRISDVRIRVPSFVDRLEDLDCILDQIDAGVRRDLKEICFTVNAARESYSVDCATDEKNAPRRESELEAQAYWRSAGVQSSPITKEDREFLARYEVSRLGEYRGLRNLVQMMYQEKISLEEAVEKSIPERPSRSGESLYQRVLLPEQPGRTLSEAVREVVRADRKQLKEQIHANPQPVAMKFGVSETEIKKQSRDLDRPKSYKTQDKSEQPGPAPDEDVKSEMVASR